MAYNPPPVSFSESNPTVSFGQIRDIILGTEGNPLAAVDAASIDARLDNKAVAADAVLRRLTVIAQKAAPERPSVDLSHKRRAYGAKTHKITGYIDDTNDDNYEFLRTKADSPAAQIPIWYATEKHLYGGTDGILASLNINHIVPESNDEIEKFEFEIEWEGKDPERTANPLSTDNSNQTPA